MRGSAASLLCMAGFSCVRWLVQSGTNLDSVSGKPSRFNPLQGLSPLPFTWSENVSSDLSPTSRADAADIDGGGCGGRWRVSTLSRLPDRSTFEHRSRSSGMNASVAHNTVIPATRARVEPVRLDEGGGDARPRHRERRAGAVRSSISSLCRGHSEGIQPSTTFQDVATSHSCPWPSGRGEDE